jgi:hypothetical protein
MKRAYFQTASACALFFHAIPRTYAEKDRSLLPVTGGWCVRWR